MKKKDLELIENANMRNNFNPLRVHRKDFQDMLSMSKPEQEGKFELQEWEGDKCEFNVMAHKESILSLSHIDSKDESCKLVVTSGLDNYIKLWDFKGKLKGSLNLNHPLPIQWDIKQDYYGRYNKDIIFTFKILELIFRRHSKSILMAEPKLMQLNVFLNSLFIKNAVLYDNGKQDSNNVLITEFKMEDDI